MKRLAPILVLLIAGCAHPTISMNASAWNLRYGSGTSDHPTMLEGGGMYFDFAPVPGSVHYFTTPFTGDGLEGKTVTATFEIVSEDAVYDADAEQGEIGPPQMHLFIEHDFDSLDLNEWWRWWCGDSQQILGSVDNKTVIVSCPLVSTSWSDEYGHTDPGEFSGTLDHMGNVGMTFGGGDGWGHGVRLVSGKSQFKLLNYTIQ